MLLLSEMLYLVLELVLVVKVLVLVLVLDVLQQIAIQSCRTAMCPH